MSRENLTRAEVLALLTEWKSRHDKLDAAFKPLLALFPSAFESDLWDSSWCLFDAYTQQLAERFGDGSRDEWGNNWLTWYAMENGFGSKGYGAKSEHTAKLRPIRTLEDLADLLGYGVKPKKGKK